MRVLINALGASLGGASRHLENFLPVLAQRDQRNEYWVYCRNSWSGSLWPKNIKRVSFSDSISSHPAKRLAFDIVHIPWHIKKNQIDCVVSLTNFGPIWCPVPHILFQRNPLYYCRWYLKNVSGRQRWETLMRAQLAHKMMKHATRVVTPSRYMTTMIQERFPNLDSEKFVTIYHGFDAYGLSEPLNLAIKEKIAYPGVRLFYPTHPAFHKGFSVLFRIIKQLSETKLQDFKLFTTCSREDWPTGFNSFERDIKNLGIESKLEFMGRIPQRQMGSLYNAMDLMVYPSLCESFGFSMIEAMGHGLPIVAADTGVNREMCGDAAFYYSPLDSKQGAEVVLKALEPSNKAVLKVNAKRRLQDIDWSWERYVKEFVDLIETTVR